MGTSHTPLPGSPPRCEAVSIAGDEVCRAIIEDVVFPQIIQQLPTQASKGKLAHLFGEGDAGHGSAWRTG